VAHRRAVLLIGHDLFVVVDDLLSNEPRAFHQAWHLPPTIPTPVETQLPEAGTYHLFFPRSSEDATPLFSLHQANTGAVELGVHRGEPPVDGVPGPGWYSTAENQLEPSPVVEFAQKGRTQVAFASVFLLGGLASSRADLALHEQGAGNFTLRIQLENGAAFTLQVNGLAAGAPVESVALAENVQTTAEE
jgi:hypothetical protein